MNKLTLTFVFISALSLSACGKSDTSTSAPAPTPTPQAQASATPVAASAPAAMLSPAERGAKVYKRCKACHTINEGGKNRVGPNLWGIIGQKAGQIDGFAYSKAMEESDIVWTEENLSEYLRKPTEFLPGGRMAFAGLKKEEDRDAVIAYIKAESEKTAE